MTLTLLLTSSGAVKDVTAAIPASTTLSAVARNGASRSAAVSIVADVTATLSNGTEAAASIVQSSASLTAELRNGTELAASLVAMSVSLPLSLTRRTNQRPSANIDAVATFAVKLPGRGYGSPVTVGSGRTGAGGTPTPGTKR